MFKIIRKYIIFYFVYNRGIARENIGEYLDALDYFYLALTLFPNSIKAYKAIARICRKNKTVLNGIDFLNKASMRFPDKSELYSIKADLYRKIKDFDNAVRECDFAIKWEGDNWKYYEQRAKIKALQGDIQGALNDLNGAIINSNSKNHKLYAQRAFLHFIKGNYQNAEKDYESAVKLNQNKGHYYYMLASVKKLINKDIEAEKDYKHAQKLLNEKIL